MQTMLEPRARGIAAQETLAAFADTTVMEPMYIAGGRQRALRPLSAGNQDWNGFDQALIIQLSPETGEWKKALKYISPPQVVAEQDPAILFQAGHIRDRELVICTQTEVMIYRLPDFKCLWYLSLPGFNDLHHARFAPNGNVLVANAGLEMVIELSRNGEIVREWNVLGKLPWADYRRDHDYRKVSTKPHHAHPNHLFCIDDEIWATRFHQGDALCLTDPRKRIPLSTERIHDGAVYDGFVYFTTVTGQIIVANPRTLRVVETIDLNTLHEPGLLLGWCRGLKIHQGSLWVGFSRIRPTKFRENISWVMRGFKRALPTHVACYDLQNLRRVMDIDLEPMGLGAVYSIFPAAAYNSCPESREEKS